MSSIFGEQWWDYMMIGVSKWKYDQLSIDSRQSDCDYYGDPSEHCHNEDWFKREFNKELQNRFGLSKIFTFAFMDSFSQSGPNKNDFIQQQHWVEETEKLWLEANGRNSTFDFLTIDDVLEQNAELKEENQRLNNIIDESIAALFEAVNVLSIHDNQTDLRMENFELDLQEINSKVDENELIMEDSIRALNTVRVQANQTDGRVDNVEEDLEVIDNTVNEIENEVEKLSEFPIGSIIPWVMKVMDDGGEDFVELPSGWMRCDGSIIPHGSIWEGKRVPNLNGEKRFLRGGLDEDVLKLEDDQIQDHVHSINDPGHAHQYEDKYAFSLGVHTKHGSSHENFNDQTITGTSETKKTGISVTGVSDSARHGDETRPKNMNVVYIIRVW